MLEGGRIQDHLYYNIKNYYCTILFIGYCAKGTLGHRLLRGDPVVHIRDREMSVYATIKKTDLLSGHGDHNDLVNFVKQQNVNKLKRVFLVHGETASMHDLQLALIAEKYNVEIAEKGITYQLDWFVYGIDRTLMTPITTQINADFEAFSSPPLGGWGATN